MHAFALEQVSFPFTNEKPASSTLTAICTQNICLIKWMHWGKQIVIDRTMGKSSQNILKAKIVLVN